jgi:hypothetical protein
LQLDPTQSLARTQGSETLDTNAPTFQTLERDMIHPPRTQLQRRQASVRMHQAALKPQDWDPRWSDLPEDQQIEIQTPGTAINLLSRSPRQWITAGQLLKKAGNLAPSSYLSKQTSNALSEFIYRFPNMGFSKSKQSNQVVKYRYMK